MYSFKKSMLGCRATGRILARDNTYTQPFLPSTLYNLNVLANDDLGIAPTTITNINTTGLSSDVAVVTVAPDGLSINVMMGVTFSSGVIYSFTYTIQDSELNTSTATVSFEDVS